MRRLYKPSDLETGYILNKRSYYSVISPEESINMVSNPEFHFGRDGYAAIGTASLTVVDAPEGARGTRALLVSSSAYGAGVRYILPLALSPNTTYTFSLDILANCPIRIGFQHDPADTDSNAMSKTVHGAGKFRRYFVTATTTQTTALWLVARALYRNSTTFYVSGLMLEQKPYPTTYFCGDMPNALDESQYVWLGAPHASWSKRLDRAYDGGRAINLATLGLDITSENGLGQVSPENQQSSTGREITITGSIRADSKEELMQKRAEMSKTLFGKDGDSFRDVYFQYQFMSGDEDVGSPIVFGTRYKTGATRNHTSITGEDVGYVFEVNTPLYLPGVASTVFPIGSTVINPTSSVCFTNIPVDNDTDTTGYGFQDSPSVIPTSNYHLAINGKMFVGVGGNLYRIDGSRMELILTLSTGNSIRALESTPDGNLWIAYDGGALARIAVYDLKNPTNPQVDLLEAEVVSTTTTVAALRAIKYVHELGSIIVGGRYDTIRTITSATFPAASVFVSTNNIVLFNTTSQTFTQLSLGVGVFSLAGMNQPLINAVEYDDRGLIWVGGRFAEALPTNGAQVASLAYNLSYFDVDNLWKPAGSPAVLSAAPTTTPLTQAQLVTALNGAVVRAIKYDSYSGNLYVGGTFNAYFVKTSDLATRTSVNVLAVTPQSMQPSIDLQKRKVYTFSVPQAMQGGLNKNATSDYPNTGTVYSIDVNAEGLVFVAGDFTRAKFSVASGSDALDVHGVAEWNAATEEFERSEFYTDVCNWINVASAAKEHRSIFYSPNFFVSDYSNYRPNKKGVVTVASTTGKMLIERVFPVDVSIGNGGKVFVELTGNGTFYKIENNTNGDKVKLSEINVQSGTTLLIRLNQKRSNGFVSGFGRYRPDFSSVSDSFRVIRGKNELVLGYFDTNNPSTAVARVFYVREVASVDEAFEA